jgi:hypothetical protein
MAMCHRRCHDGSRFHLLVLSSRKLDNIRCLFCGSLFLAARQVSKGRAKAGMQERKTNEQPGTVQA